MRCCPTGYFSLSLHFFLIGQTGLTPPLPPLSPAPLSQYTLLANTTESGIPPMQALFFQFPDSPSLYNNSDQFLVGTSLLVTPVLEPNVTTVTGTLPGGDSTLWRDFYTHEVLPSGSYTFDAPLGHIPLSVRGGSIHLLHKEPGYTIKETRESPYELLVALDKDGNAHGSGYFDDGLSMPVTSSKKVWFGAQKGKVWGYASEGESHSSPLISPPPLGPYLPALT